MSAVVRWLRLTAACPTSPPSSCASSSRKPRRLKNKQQPAQQAQPPCAQHGQQLPAQHAQQAAELDLKSEQPDEAMQDAAAVKHAVPSTAPLIPTGAQPGSPVTGPTALAIAPPAMMAEHTESSLSAAAASAAGSAADGLVSDNGTNALPVEAAVSIGGAAAPAAAPLVAPVCSSWGGSPQQEWVYMDTLAQLRSVMFEDIAVVSSEELPAAGMHQPVIPAECIECSTIPRTCGYVAVAPAHSCLKVCDHLKCC